MKKNVWRVQSVVGGRMSVLSLSVLSALACHAQAQQAPTQPARPATAPVETIVVTGQRASLRKAIAAQEEADNIKSVVSADDIGALPDKNAAEALARLPGVSVQRDQGEGRYVSIRGLGPDLNSVTINGAFVPAPEAGRRGVALDVLPAGLIRSLEVTKTLTPDMDGNSIGGTIEVKTLSAFDLPGKLLSFGLAGSNDENTGKNSPAGNVLWADRFLNGKVGLAIGASTEKRDFGSDNVETGGAWTGDRLSGFELRDYLPNRERHAVGLNLDYRPEPGESYYLRTFFSQFSDDEVRDRLTISNISGGTAAAGQSVTARGERRLRERKYTQEITSLSAGLDRRFGDWRVEAALGSSKASEDTPEALNDGRFRGASNFVGVGFNNSQIPQLFGPANLFDPASYNLNGITLQARLSEDEEQHVKLDLTRKMDLGGFATDLKFGAKVSRREKTNNTEQWGYTSSSTTSPNFFGAGPTSMTAFTGPTIDFPLGPFGPGLDPGLIRSRVAGLNRDAARLLGASVLNDYTMNEDIDAAYLQASTTFNGWTLLAGARNERTKFDALGNQVTGGTTVTPVRTNRSYSNWLPSVHARFDLDKQTSVRGAISSSVVRANFSQLAPGIDLASATEATIGNPELKPLKSRNVDLGIEHLLGQDGAVSAYVFSKDIKDFTYTTNLAGTGPWVGYTSAVSFANGDKARVNGIELSYSQSLRMLPAPWNGLIVGANATFTDSKAKLSRFDRTANAVLSRDIPLPGQSDRVFNIMVGYEGGPISTRLALNHKSPYLLELGDILNPAQDRVVDTQQQLDFSFSYRVTKQVQVVFEALNLNNEKYYVYQGSSAFNAQYEEYGRTFKLGVKIDLF